MRGFTFKRCGCRDPQTRRQLGAACPRLKNAGHGKYGYALLIPTSHGEWKLKRDVSDRKRDAVRELGLVNELLEVAAGDDRVAALIGDLIRDKTRRGGKLPTTAEVERRLGAGRALDRSITVGEWPDEWFTGKRDLRATTRRYYASNIRLYLRPQLGEVPLDRLRVSHLDALFSWIEQTNSARRRPISPSTMQRIRGTLRSSLSDAMRQGLLSRNVAKDVRLPSGRRAKPVVWTMARVAAFEKACAERIDKAPRRTRTGRASKAGLTLEVWRAVPRPSPVMVWTPDQTSRFLASARRDRLSALYHLIAHRGLRRGEAIGLPWTEVDLDEASVTISQQIIQIGWEVDRGEPKTDSGVRVVPLDTETVEVLRTHRVRQEAERALWVPPGSTAGLSSPGRTVPPSIPSTRADGSNA